MFDRKGFDSLLIEAATKLVWLRSQDGWRTELPGRCPPILWFGNALSPKPAVLTIGANPSRWEYLDESCRNALKSVKARGDESLLIYREPPENRFRVLRPSGESLELILSDRDLRDEIVTGYNDYFHVSRRPYTRWFGFAKEDSYNAEGFLHGLGATYYDLQYPLQAIHIDLLPFATLSDFKSLDGTVQELFTSQWAQRTVASLIRLFRPIAVIGFGKTNVQRFSEHIDNSICSLPWKQYQNSRYQIGQLQQFNSTWIGLTVNLGNPIGFDHSTLTAFGQHVAADAALFDGSHRQ